MEVEITEVYGWDRALDSARKTIGKKPLHKEPSKMVRNCIYRGFCPELESCGFVFSPLFQKEREEYMRTDY